MGGQVVVTEATVTIPGIRAVRAWLGKAPANDPVDRLNAPFMQVLLIAVGMAIALVRLYAVRVEPEHVLQGDLGQRIDLATDLLMMLSAWTGVVLIRRGRFRTGIRQFLAVVLLSAAAAYAVTGYSHSPPDPTPVLLMAVGGLVLGRRALWSIYASLVGVLALGQMADNLWLGHSGALSWQAYHTLPMLMLAYLLVALILDQSIAALRTTLAQSIQRGEALLQANERIAQEIEERERTRNQLYHSRKMDAVGRAASGVAHDFGNVLNVVLGYATQREQLADMGTPALINALEGVEIAALRGLAISRKLLNFSRQDVEATQVFDAGEAVAELAPMLRQLLGNYIQLDLRPTVGRLPVLLDRAQFELMLLNIAANARDAMPDGGRFSVAAALAPDGSRVELLLADTGMGMSADVQAKVFEPFYTTKPFGHGTGLGLSVVASLIEAAGGKVEVSSVPGEGTCFRVRLPLCTASVGELQPSPANR
ncbi:MAG TPA: HAMP domain-containing sensor histidine kinase [Dyella sp.]|nr:HAMP domain-containing sensor histidine kinase [Dyella sp.]